VPPQLALHQESAEPIAAAAAETSNSTNIQLPAAKADNTKPVLLDISAIVLGIVQNGCLPSAAACMYDMHEASSAEACKKSREFLSSCLFQQGHAAAKFVSVSLDYYRKNAKSKQPATASAPAPASAAPRGRGRPKKEAVVVTAAGLYWSRADVLAVACLAWACTRTDDVNKTLRDTLHILQPLLGAMEDAIATCTITDTNTATSKIKPSKNKTTMSTATGTKVSFGEEDGSALSPPNDRVRTSWEPMYARSSKFLHLLR
jgi:hypothetical protein